MFKDTKEGTTHHHEDTCYKCDSCGGHYGNLIGLKCDNCIRLNTGQTSDGDIKFLFIFAFMMFIVYIVIPVGIIYLIIKLL